jgi:N6-L-threonylcarbamoyladenine synthase
MLILGIETSCDETSAALIKEENGKIEMLSNIIASSLVLHAKTGGIIPEVAAREQVKYIIPVIEKALEKIKNPRKELDAIAVTVGPGLIGSLLVGVETARTLSYLWKKPLIPINHLFGHIYANWIDKTEKEIEFPAIALIVSGGHTDLLLMEGHGKTKWLGGTRDDAAGEVFDKTGRLLKLPYPGGVHIEKMAIGINKDIYNFPRPLIGSDDYDFSFSGLKTAVLREIETIEQLNNETISNISYSLQNAVFDVLTKKTLRAAIEHNAKSILLGGGVTANNELKKRFELEIRNLKLEIPLFIPEKRLCTDNAAMIAASAAFNKKLIPWQKITANPELYFD